MNEFTCINNIAINDNLKFVNQKEDSVQNTAPPPNNSSTGNTDTNNRATNRSPCYSNEIECYTKTDDLTSYYTTSISDLGIDQLNNYCFNVGGVVGECGEPSSNNITTLSSTVGLSSGSNNIINGPRQPLQQRTNTTVPPQQHHDDNNIQHQRSQSPSLAPPPPIPQQPPLLPPPPPSPSPQIIHQQNNIRLPQQVLFQDNIGNYNFQPLGLRYSNSQQYGISNNPARGHIFRNPHHQQILGYHHQPVSHQSHHRQQLSHQHNIIQSHQPVRNQLDRKQQIQSQARPVVNTTNNNTQLQYNILHHPLQQQQQQHQQQRHYIPPPQQYNNIQQHRPQLPIPNQHYIGRNHIGVQPHNPKNNQILGLHNQQQYNLENTNTDIISQGYNSCRPDVDSTNNFELHNIEQRQIGLRQQQHQNNKSNQQRIVLQQQQQQQQFHTQRQIQQQQQQLQVVHNQSQARPQQTQQVQQQQVQRVQQIQQQQVQQQQPPKQQQVQDQVQQQEQRQQQSQQQQQYSNNINASENKRIKTVTSSPTALFLEKDSEYHIITDVNDQIILSQPKVGGQFLIPSATTNIRGEQQILNLDGYEASSILNHEISLSEYIQKQTHQEDFSIAILENQEIQNLIQFDLNPSSSVIISSTDSTSSSSSAILQQNVSPLNNISCTSTTIQQIGIIPTNNNNSSSIIQSNASQSTAPSPVQLPLNNNNTNHNQQQYYNQQQQQIQQHQLQQQQYYHNQQQLANINNKPVNNLTTGVDCEKSPIHIKVLASPSSAKFTTTTTTTIVAESLSEKIIPQNKYQFSLKSLDKNINDNNIISNEIDKEKLILHKKRLDRKQAALKKKLLIEEERLHRQKQIELENERQVLLEKQVKQINSKVYVNCSGYNNIQSYYDNAKDDLGLLMHNSPNNSNSSSNTAAIAANTNNTTTADTVHGADNNSGNGDNVVVSKSDDHSVTLKILKTSPQMSNPTDVSGKFKIPSAKKTNPVVKKTLDADTPQLLKKGRGRPRKKQLDLSSDGGVASTSTPTKKKSTPKASPAKSTSAKIKPIKTSTPKNISRPKSSIGLQESVYNNNSSSLSSRGEDSCYYNTTSNTSTLNNDNNNIKSIIENSSIVANECVVMTTPMSTSLKHIEESIAAVASITGFNTSNQQYIDNDVDYLQHNNNQGLDQKQRQQHHKQPQNNMPLLNSDSSSKSPSSNLQTVQVRQQHKQPHQPPLPPPSPLPQSTQMLILSSSSTSVKDIVEESVINNSSNRAGGSSFRETSVATSSPSATHAVTDGVGVRTKNTSNAFLTSPMATPTKSTTTNNNNNTTANSDTAAYVKDSLDIDIQSVNTKDRRKRKKRKIFLDESNTSIDEQRTDADVTAVSVDAVDEDIVVLVEDADDNRFDDSISITSNSISSVSSRSTCKSKSEILSKTKSLIESKSINMSSSGEHRKHRSRHHRHRSRSDNKHKSKSSRSKRKAHEKYEQKIDNGDREREIEEEEEEVVGGGGRRRGGEVEEKEKYDDIVYGEFVSGGNRRRRRRSKSDFSVDGKIKRVRRTTIDDEEDLRDSVNNNDNDDNDDNISSITDISENNIRIDSRIILDRSDDEYTNNDQNSIIFSSVGRGRGGGRERGERLGVGGVGGGVVVGASRCGTQVIGDVVSSGAEGIAPVISVATTASTRTTTATATTAEIGSGNNDRNNSYENNMINFEERQDLKEIISLTSVNFNFERKNYFDINSRTQRTWLHNIFMEDVEKCDDNEQILPLFSFLFSKEDYSFKQMPKSLIRFLEMKNNSEKEFEIKNKIRASIINTVYSLYAHIKDNDSIMSVASVEEEFLVYVRSEFGSMLNSSFKNTFSGRASDLEPYLKHIVERGYRKSLKPRDPYDVVAWTGCSTIENAVKHISYIITKVIEDFEKILKNKHEEKTPIVHQQYIDHIIEMLNKEMSLSTKNIRSLLIQLAQSSELFTFMLFGINKPNEDMVDRNNKIKNVEWSCGMLLNLSLSISKVLVIRDKLKDKAMSVPSDNDEKREFMKRIYSKNVLFCVPLMMALNLSPTTNKNNISGDDSRAVHNGVYSSFFDFCNQDLDSMICEEPTTSTASSSSGKIQKYSNAGNSNDVKSTTPTTASSSRYLVSRGEGKRKYISHRYDESSRAESYYDDTNYDDDYRKHGNATDDRSNMENYEEDGENTAIEIITDEEVDDSLPRDSTKTAGSAQQRRKLKTNNPSVRSDDKRKKIKR